MKRFILIVILILGGVFLIFGVRYLSNGSNQPDRVVTSIESMRVSSQNVPQSYPTQEITDKGVTIAITPIQLAQDSKIAVFAVTLNTHSVDLAYDLTELATLQLDEGTPLTAILWDGNQGGHHISGTLSFQNVDIAGASTVNMVIREVADVPTWTFTWQLQ
ncbi:MAG: hypothetical protein P1S60_04920 [Anaerolineae bacterium]|nr:hypothetical protein [Anaerolineae bacterium]